MLTIWGSDGRGERFCDGFSRRSFLQIGGLAMGGLAMPQLLQAQAASHGAGKWAGHASGNNKSIIMIFLPGGPPHQDMWDLKPDAPAEIRGEFKPIRTAVPGIEICELFPRLASIADKLIFIRSIVGATGDHYAHQCLTGRSHQNQPPGGWPALGSVVAKLQGSGNPALPAYVGLAPPMGHVPWSDNGRPGFLGPAYAPFKPNGDGKQDLTLNGVTLDRLRDRRSLLTGFDQLRRDIDSSGFMEGLDAFNQQAFGVLTSSKLAHALDIEQADQKLRDRYGRGEARNQDDGGPMLLDTFLVARQLVEAGVKCVTLAFSRWDWHGGTFNRSRESFPMLDQAVSALVEDLYMRGMDKDVSVIVWGEFGRTPQINKDAGRDHWPRVSCALMACGGLRAGQVIGSTTRDAGEPKDRPVHFQEVFATLYHAMGIDPETTTITDLTGRPRHLVDPEYKAMPELI